MDNTVGDVQAMPQGFNQAKFVGIPETPFQILKKLFSFSMLMIVMPLATYFISKSLVFEGLFNMSSNNSYFYGAVSTIIAIHICLGIFIYAAVQDGTTKPARKID